MMNNKNLTRINQTVQKDILNFIINSQILLIYNYNKH
jgi:hypothetical protein